MVDAHLRRAAAHGRGHLVGQRDHGRAVEQRFADAGREIGRAGAERAEAGAGLAGQPSADIGHHAGAAFMRGQDELDPVGLAQRFHVVDPAAARHAEDVADAHFLQGIDDGGGDGLVLRQIGHSLMTPSDFARSMV